MTSTNPFGGSTPLAKGTGYIYVPRALLNDYKTAENWSTYAAQIRAIEDYPELINRVPYATETNVFNIYNNGLGYKEGYRLSSKNVEKPQNNSVITGYIYAKPDNVIQMHNATWGTTESDGYCYISFYNSDYQQVATANRYKMADPDTGISNVSNVNIEKSTISTVNGVTTFNVIPTVDYSYIRISATGNGADMIVTVT